MRNYDILKNLCKKIYYVGFGNFWFENEVLGDDNSIRYRIYFYLLFSMYGFLTLLEVMAAVFAEFPEDEKWDSVTFSISHTIVIIKMFSILVNKKTIKKLIQNIIMICELHEQEALMNEKYKIMKMNVLAYFVTCYGSAACFVFEGFRKMHEGSHFVTVVTYYPSFEDNSGMATAARFITTIILFIMLMAMIILVDSFTMIILIMFKYKFNTLRNYFNKLRKDIDTLHKSSNSHLAANHLVNGLIEGIIMHKDLLRISKEIDKAFGTVMAMQLCQTSGSAVSLLLQIALSDQLTFVTSIKVLFFVFALFFLLGLYLCNAGEITYQASLLSESICYCGWHMCPIQYSRERKLGSLVLHACTQAQRPLVMKAFKMVELTYGTFLWVLRGTYSVFALFYAQHKK